MTERLFSTYQIAKLLGTTLGSVAQWMEKGSLNFCSMPDGSVRITESDLIKFLTQQGIDLGEVLAKAGYTKVETVGSDSSLLPRPISLGTAGNLTEAATTTEPPEPVDDEPSEEPSISQMVDAARPDLRAEQVCDAILADAVRSDAQAICLTPHRDHLVLQLRIDGALRDKLNFDHHLPDDLRRQTIACLLNLANPDVDPENLTVPLTAEFTQTIDDREFSLRLSAIPTAHGPRLVIHLPPKTADIESLALEDAARTRLEELLQADGLILVAAKRRTGRDLMLRALLNAADTDGRTVIAIEQNPAPDMDNVVQLQINPAAGLTYAIATDAMEHQDADTIMLTELRDPETALKAFDAAHDGALVIAGVNATSAAEAITELLAMGIEPWPLGGTLKAIVDRGGRSDRAAPSGVTFVEGQLAETIRHNRTRARRGD
ncbi:MAG: ATPase, T2SS/T4P/T4SS family [Phycisphaerae bacterium]|jgi:type II secretory ATPase GspE/PulE/Tfp pilus assembly ATPase PilB-like protein|nr:ATPase, T2SS/T4P/T4SS family [Phycisphaerae bacterium]